MYHENASCVCFHVQTCTQMQIKTQSSIFKMLFVVVILLLPEAMGSLGLIHENACRDPHLLDPLDLFSAFLECCVWKKISFLLLSKPVQWKPLCVA